MLTAAAGYWARYAGLCQAVGHGDWQERLSCLSRTCIPLVYRAGGPWVIPLMTDQDQESRLRFPAARKNDKSTCRHRKARSLLFSTSNPAWFMRSEEREPNRVALRVRIAAGRAHLV